MEYVEKIEIKDNMQSTKLIKEGIRMPKLVKSAHYGLFSHSKAVYDYKTVYDLFEAVELCKNGWYLDDDSFFHNLTMNLYLDVKKLYEKTKV